jgi:hypothetical protein
MKLLVLFLAVALLASVSAARAVGKRGIPIVERTSNSDSCPYAYSAVLSWTNDKIYALDGHPYWIGGYDNLTNQLNLSLSEIESLRLNALQWFNTQFGIPTQNATFDPVTKTTTIQGYGSVYTVYLTDCYKLIASNLVNYVEDIHDYHLSIGEFTFTADQSAYGKPYGGRMAALYAALGADVPTIQPGDGFSFGYYYVQKGDRLIKRISMRARFPTRADMPFRNHEELDLIDAEWGEGQSIMQLGYAYSPNPVGLLSQINSVWKFPKTNDIFALYGI